MNKIPKILLLTMIMVLGLSINKHDTNAANYALRHPEPNGNFVYSLAAGETKTGTIIVENREDKNITVAIYAADPAPSANGTFAIKTNLDQQNNVGLWLTFEQTSINIEPKEKKIVNFTIKVPENTSPGTFKGGIAVQLVDNKENQKQNTVGVVSVSRTANPFIIEIPGEKIHAFEWTDFSHSSTRTNNHTFNLSFKNTGNTLIIVNGQLIVAKSDSSESETLILSDMTAGTQEVMNVTKKWDQKPFFGSYHATAELTFSEFDVMTGEITNPQTLTKELDFFVFPWKEVLFIIAVIIFLLLILLFLYIIKRETLKSAKPYTITKDETLTEIAAKTGVPWKRIARLNKIKPPYSLQPGQTILIPKP